MGWTKESINKQLEPINDWIEKYSTEYGINPNLARALIIQESGGRPDVVSSKDAYGYTQLLKETAEGLGVDRTIPEENVKGGIKYLSQQLGRYKDINLALAAYNSGSGNVDKYNGVPPFPETQNYVSAISAYYERLTGKRIPKSEKEYNKYDELNRKVERLGEKQEKQLGLYEKMFSRKIDQAEQNVSEIPDIDKDAIEDVRKLLPFYYGAELSKEAMKEWKGNQVYGNLVDASLDAYKSQTNTMANNFYAQKEAYGYTDVNMPTKPLPSYDASKIPKMDIDKIRGEALQDIALFEKIGSDENYLNSLEQALGDIKGLFG